VGKGVQEDPMREVKEWWTLEGNFVTGYDPTYLQRLSDIAGLLSFKGLDTGDWINDCAKEIADKLCADRLHGYDQEVAADTIRNHLKALFNKVTHP
jgi:hypothetical protein